MERIIRAITICIVLAGFAFGVVAATRVDASTIALLSGAVIGVLVTAPCAAFVTWFASRRRDEIHPYRHMNRVSAPLTPEPPAYWVIASDRMLLDQQNQRMPAGILAPWPNGKADFPCISRPRRRFMVIGEDGAQVELEDMPGMLPLESSMQTSSQDDDRLIL